MALATYTLAEWSAGGGGSIVLTLDDAAKTIEAVSIVNGSVPVRAEIVMRGVTRGGRIPAGFDQTVALPSVPYTEGVGRGGNPTFDFGVTRITVSS